MSAPPIPIERRFWTKVDATDGLFACWIWTGASRDMRYGSIWLGGRHVPAHRIAWTLANGREVPHGLEVCHTCDNTRCVNPAHLWLGTRLENEQDKTQKGRRPTGPLGHRSEVCPRGHQYELGRRGCGICCAERQRQRRASHGAAA